ncbi:zinc finger CCHC domain-containing protein 7-like isoform X2 [Ruditapes philippinarum]|uniref:zinc finger CCHC domain-containing protein 7-like isoform X2 n=1 Tax=Ruditapes philippinarum TaxID=129788 RepID=UPI00295B33F8|nr:zinc finger CCHC domain-containing protein 7-like isoform X2 [Ruditapes philippinarum]
MDEVYGEVSGENSSDDYEQEQLEIALYSKIHFEQNSENPSLNKEHDIFYCEDDTVEKDFIFTVQGNEKKGFVASECNADIILNEALEEKYSHVNFKNDVAKRKNNKAVNGNSKDGNSNGSSFSKQSHKQSLSNSTSSNKGTKKSAKTLPQNKSGRDRKTLTAEKLILETNSDVDEEKDMIVVSEDEDKEDVVETIYLSDSQSSDMVLSGSEADSLDIVLGEPEERLDDIQTNVRSSPRSNMRYTYRKLSHEDAIPDKEEKNNDDESHWAICREDSYRDLISATKGRGRYYKPIKCHNCDKEGHLSKNCPQPKKVTVCIMCSEPGHMSRTCPQSMCFNCQEPGHDSKQCTYPRRSFQYTCFRCNMRGHDQSRCPDSWRQFHVTVNPDKIQQPAVQTLRKTPSCFNCGEEGHLGHECEEDRMNKFLTIYTPFICRYQTMKEFSYKMRLTDEAEERPLKKSRSDSWLVNRKVHLKPNNHHIFGNSDEERKDNMDDGPSNRDDFIRGKDKKKPSKFAHIVKKKPGLNTGRNNFDKMQFTLLNVRKGDGNERTGVTTRNSENPKSNKKKKKNKGGKGKMEDKIKKTQDKGKAITGLEKNAETDLSTKGETKHRNSGTLGKKRKPSFQIGTEFIDLTIDKDKDGRTCKEKKWEETEKRFSSVRNDRLRSDDLFSMQKIAKLQSSGQFDVPNEEEVDVDHQVHNNEWWKNQKNRKRRQNRKRNKQRNHLLHN